MIAPTDTIGDDVRLFRGDCRAVLPLIGTVDACITDPPYGETALAWDKQVGGWENLIETPHLWCFGSFRSFLDFRPDGWTHAQEIIWEKHNGSGNHNDRFRRVHELIVHWYKGKWSELYKQVQYTNDATARTVRRKARPPHFGNIGASDYSSIEGGPRMMRSVLRARSCHGEAVHPTQKPVETIIPLIEYSVPPGGTVLDPFMGSGSVGIACLKTGRKFIGIELDPVYYGAALARIEHATGTGAGQLFAAAPRG